jgi:hypothetical protein
MRCHGMGIFRLLSMLLPCVCACVFVEVIFKEQKGIRKKEKSDCLEWIMMKLGHVEWKIHFRRETKIEKFRLEEFVK